ncbi:MFS transporter [Streptomyces sp. NPDC046881]|uniref:MFS transporter n=1 Tax=Streptomyces sp. NPDC046881 TaxID=3155374 RepID=UPI0033CEB065
MANGNTSAGRTGTGGGAGPADGPAAPAPRARLGRRLAALWPSGRAERGLVAMALADATGTGAFLSVSVVFLTRSVGLSPSQVAVGLSLAAGVSLVTTVPVALVADRFGPRRLLVLVTLWRAACFLVYPFVPGFTSFAVLMVLMGLVDKAAAPLGQVLVGMAVPEDARVRTMAVMGAFRNCGYAAGALLGSLALLADHWWAYATVILANAASFVGLAAVAGRLPLRPGATADASRLRRTLSFDVFKDRPYAVLAVLNGALTMHITLLSVGIPMWVTQASHAPRSTVSAVVVLNAVLAVLFQVRASRGAEEPTTAARLMRTAGFALAGCCALLALVPPLPAVPAVAVLLASAVALTAAELFQSAGGWGVSYGLARTGQESAYVSLFWLGVGLQQIIAPLVVALVVSRGAFAWLLVGALLAAAGAAAPRSVGWAVRDREKSRHRHIEEN